MPRTCWRPRPTARSKHRDALNEEIDRHTVKRTSEDWIERLNKAGVPSGPIYSRAV
jgi:crotonobetainyl-CoA:carnitine CoA-transferase CaiB-like acyl-CoA transferase